MMIMKDGVITLSEDLFYGKGTHKKSYRHPHDSSKCIKMAYSALGQKDLDRELRYLEVVSSCGGEHRMLPKYFGPVETNIGKGHVYEFITDYNGKACLTLELLCRDDKLLAQYFDEIVNKLKQLKADMLNENIITMGLFAENILFQRVSASEFLVRVVNDMGSAALIPLEYYFGFIAKIRIKKRWRRFIEHLLNDYGSKELVVKLVNAIK